MEPSLAQQEENHEPSLIIQVPVTTERRGDFSFLLLFFKEGQV